MAARIVERQSGGSRPPVGAIPMSSASGRRASASSRVATAGTSNRGWAPTISDAIRPAIVESSRHTTVSRP